MNLERLAMLRAEEQVREGSESWRIDEKVEWRRKKPRARLVLVGKRKGGKAPSCLCGECLTCYRREAMARHRERKRNGQPQGKPGRPLDPVRVCSECGRRIAKRNDTGVCSKCQHSYKWRRQGRAAVKRGLFSHGGGI